MSEEEKKVMDLVCKMKDDIGITRNLTLVECQNLIISLYNIIVVHKNKLEKQQKEIESLKESNKSFKQQYNQQVLENAKIVNFYENDDTHKELYKLRKEIEEKTKSINRKNRLLKNIRDELVGDRMEEFDDYVIYLQDKYLKILDESEE